MVGLSYMLYHIRSAKFLYFAIFTTVVASAFVTFFNPEDFGRLAAIQRILTNSTSELDDGSVAARSDAWTASISMFNGAPVMGVGLGNWSQHSNVQLHYPHNWFFEISGELGVFGIITFLLALLIPLRNATVTSLAYTVFFLICLSFSGDMSYYRFLFALSLGALSVGERQRKIAEI